MGSNIGGFVNGFVKQVNRDMEAAKMAEYEQFIHDQQLEDWKIKENEKQRIDQEAAATEATRLENAATARATAEGVLNAQQAGFQAEAIRLANEEDYDAKLAYVMQQFPNLPEDMAKIYAQGDIKHITAMKEGENTYLPDQNRFTTRMEVLQENAEFMAGVTHPDPSNYADGFRYEDTDWYKKKVLSILEGQSLYELEQEGWSQELVLNEAGQIIDIPAVFKDPNMHTPESWEREAIQDAVDVKLSFLNSSSPYLFDASGNLLKGDAAIAVNSLRQKVLTEYVRLRSLGHTDVDEQRITDAIFDPFIDFLPAVSPENREAVDGILNANNRLDVIERMTNIDDLTNIYKNLNDRIELSNNDIIQTGDVYKMQEVADAIDNNSTFKSYMAELSDESVVLPEDAPRVLLSGPGGEAGNPILDEQLRKEAERINTEKVENARATISGAQRQLNALNDRVQRLSNNINAQKQKMEEAGIPISNIPQTLYDQLSEAQRKLVAGQQRFGSIIEAAEAIIPSPPVEERSGPPGVK